MSDESDPVEDASASTETALEFLEDWYQVPVLAGLAAFMFWLRARTAGNFIRPDGVFFSGNDAWYHFRQVTYTVNHFPRTMPFDPWTNFSYGTSVGQFGTLFDQLIAAAALVIGLGDPSPRLVATVTVYAPPVFGTLVLLPTYYLGKRLGGRGAGVFAAIVLALVPGMFLQRSLAGAADHNIAEPLFQSTAVLATMVALHVAERDKPVWEQFRDRDWTGLRAPVGWSVVAGIATGLYLWLWPPGVLLVGILGVFYLLHLTATYLRGGSPEHVAVVGAVSMSVTTALVLAPLTTMGFESTKFSLLQPLAAASVAAFSVAMAALARQWDERDLPRLGYSVAVFAVVGGGVLFVMLFLPDLYGLVRNNLLRFVGFDVAAGQRTISEARPLLARYANLPQAVGVQYGLAFFTAIFGALLMVLRAGDDDGHDAERLLVLVWFTFVTAAAFTQIRFNYYLAVPVAVLNGFALYWLLDLVGGAPSFESAPDAGQVTVVFLALLIVVAPLAAGVNDQGGASGGDLVVPTAQDVSSGNSPRSSMLAWNDMLEWMEDNTPAEGNYAGAGNAGEVPYYGTFQTTSNFDYPDGYYGVMSWWDYGHWITVQGKRIPVANPFQQNAATAANFLLAPNESAANAVLSRIDEPDAKTRYVMIDWQMASVTAKFHAPVTFYDAGDVSISDFRTRMYRQTSRGGLRTAFFLYEDRYYNSTMVRLYRNHGSAVDVKPVVTDWETLQATTQSGERVSIPVLPSGNQTLVRSFPNMSAARQYVQRDGSSQIGGIAGYPTGRVPAMEHYRLVHATNRTAPQFFVNDQVAIQRGAGGIQQFILTRQLRRTVPSTVKTFERVDGATISGSNAPANSEVRVSVRMHMEEADRNFTYTAFAQTGPNGSFSLTVPYSTTGYEAFGVDEGYTNVTVTARGPYRLTAPVDAGQNETVYTANATVTEGQVLGVNESATTVRLTARNTTPTNGTGNQSASAASIRLPAGGDGGTSGHAATAPTPTPTPVAARVA